MEQKLEIGGKEYTFVANRKAACALSNINNEDTSEMLDVMFFALLKTRHNMSKKEASELLDVAEEEYEIKDLLEFCTKMIDMVFTKAKENKKKIAFLSQK